MEEFYSRVMAALEKHGVDASKLDSDFFVHLRKSVHHTADNVICECPEPVTKVTIIVFSAHGVHLPRRLYRDLVVQRLIDTGKGDWVWPCHGGRNDEILVQNRAVRGSTAVILEIMIPVMLDEKNVERATAGESS
jgi:hypothetical protein